MTKLEITRVIEVLTNLREQYNSISVFYKEGNNTLQKIDLKLAEYLDML